jgi:hypothetical protein
MNESLIYWTFFWTCVGAIAAITAVVLTLVPNSVREALWYKGYSYLRQYFAVRKFFAAGWIRPRRKPIAFGFMLLGVPVGLIGVLCSVTIIAFLTIGLVYNIIPIGSYALLLGYNLFFGMYCYSVARDTTVEYLQLR